MIYLLDANVLITANNTYYPVDRVEEYWSWLEHQAQSGHVKMPIEVLEEIQEGPDQGDLLFEWISQEHIKTALLLKEDVDPQLVDRVVQKGYAEDLNDSEILQIGRDPFLIAYGLSDQEKRCVVTSEVSKPKKKRQNRHIPDVCAGLGVKCIDPFQFLKELNFSTKWNG